MDEAQKTGEEIVGDAIKRLRAEADTAILHMLAADVDVVGAATKCLPVIKQEMDHGDYAFEELAGPPGTRFLQAVSRSGTRILVCQANHAKYGITYAGTAICESPSGMLTLILPAQLAEYLYRRAVALRN